MPYLVSFPSNYSDRVLAFLDILGWSKAVRDEHRKDEVVKAILAVHDEAFWTIEARRLAREPDLYFTTFSDCIVLSCPAQSPLVGHVLQGVCRLYVELLGVGFMCRGAVVVGPATHTDQVAIGPALVDAVTLEKGLAIHPRIVIREADLKRLGDEFEEGDVLRAGDGVAYLNALVGHTPFAELRKEKLSKLHSSWRQRLEKAKRDSSQRPDIETQKILAKHEWLVDHFKAAAKTIGLDLVE